MEVKFKIDGMKCDGCKRRVENCLSTIKGVESYQVSLETGMLFVKVKKEKQVPEIISKISALDFSIQEVE
ncbi:MAG TPA: heavy-metal-associated domain-containing protein [Candidatus Scybalousia intestinigallinarum]|nr:heavy-metal-associated domain-containing protein [Candidatus Scybalousia intestinigallinarum]